MKKSIGWYHTGTNSFDNPEIKAFDKNSNPWSQERLSFPWGPYRSFAAAKKDMVDFIKADMASLRVCLSNVKKLKNIITVALVVFAGLISSNTRANDFSLIGGGNLILDNGKPHYQNMFGAHLDVDVVGPFTAGVLATNNNVVAATAGLAFKQDENVGSVGFIGGENTQTNAMVYGMYANRNLFNTPLTMGTVLMGNVHGVSYGLTLGIHW